MEAAAAVGVCRNASGFFHDRIVGVLRRDVAMSRRCAGGSSRGRREGVNRFGSRSDSESDNFFLHNQSFPSPSHTLVVNVSTLSVPSVGVFLAVGRRNRNTK